MQFVEGYKAKRKSMMNEHITLLYPQWQGGGMDKSTYYGATEIEQMYLTSAKYLKVPVSAELFDLSERDNIVGYNDIFVQISCAQKIIYSLQPETIFTIGGGCDADIPTIAYLNDKLNGNLALVWIDAHGDINSPKESTSKLFHGMPVRTLLGDGEAQITKLIRNKLVSSQVLFCGARELDDAEARYIKTNAIPIVSVQEAETSANSIIATLQAIGYANVYIHLDLDVIDPPDFPHTPLPSLNGISGKSLLEVLRLLKENFNLVGMGIFEYKPANARVELLSSVLEFGLKIK